MVQPTREELRRESMRRVQIGMTGLGGVLLLVGLTNVVLDNVRKDNRLAAAQGGAAGEAANAVQPSQPSEPLADLGVTPAPDTGSSGAPAVPDLEPDPQLQKPMDRDPAR